MRRQYSDIDEDIVLDPFISPCWNPTPPAPLTLELCSDPNIYYVPGEPNEPYDPNWPGDPNDPNCPGYDLMGAGALTISSSMSLNAYGADLSGSASELEQAIDFLYEAAAECPPEDAAILYDFLPTLEAELAGYYGTMGLCDF